MAQFETTAWTDYTILVRFSSGVHTETTTLIEIEVVDATDAVVASGYFRLCREWHLDEVIGREFDVHVLSNIDVAAARRGRGVGTAIVATLARRFPDALIVGENQNANAAKWHQGRLDVVFPTRLLRDDGAEGVRVTPGIELDPSEIA